MYYTLQHRVKIFNNKGTDIGNIPAKDTPVPVTGAQVNIPLRGACFPVIYNKLSGFVMVGMLRFVRDTNPPLPPPAEEKPPVSNVPLYQFLPPNNPRKTAWNDAVKKGTPVGYPDIIPLGVGDGARMALTREWQLYIAAINPRLAKNKVAGMLGNAVAFCNGTGFGGSVKYQNWLTGEDTKSKDAAGNPRLPLFDKVRTCGYACHTGRVEGDTFVVSVLDGNQPPPNIADVNPKSHPHLFFHATIVWMDKKGNELSRKPFINKRAIAPEWGYNFEVTLMPLVSRYTIRVPLAWVKPVTGYGLPYLGYP